MQNRFVKTIIYFANYKVTYQLVKIMKIDGKILDKRISSILFIAENDRCESKNTILQVCENAKVKLSETVYIDGIN